MGRRRTMARPFRERYAEMAGTAYGAIVDALINEITRKPECGPYLGLGEVRIACTPGETSPTFIMRYQVTDDIVHFLQVEVYEPLGAWGTEEAGETAH